MLPPYFFNTSCLHLCAHASTGHAQLVLSNNINVHYGVLEPYSLFSQHRRSIHKFWLYKWSDIFKHMLTIIKLKNVVIVGSICRASVAEHSINGSATCTTAIKSSLHNTSAKRERERQWWILNCWRISK